jgi:hypothetical protein
MTANSRPGASLIGFAILITLTFFTPMRYLTDRVPKSSKCNASLEPVSLGGPETLTKRKLIERLSEAAFSL